jgi:murein DD-endopeptidase MepM/ murein hydrolase activator NlpD
MGRVDVGTTLDDPKNDGPYQATFHNDGETLMKLLLFMTLISAIALAQSPSPGLAGDWEGTLMAGPNSLRVVFHITRSSDEIYLGRIDSLDQGTSIPISSIQVSGDSIRIDVPAARANYQGTWSADKTAIKGTWSQGGALPLDLKRMPKTDAPTDVATPAPPPDLLETIIKTTGGVPIEIDIPVAPIPVTGHGGATNLIYELHMTNFAPVPLHLERLEVLNGTTSVVSYDGATLNGILQELGPDDLTDKRVLGPGLRAVAFILVRFNQNATVPQTLKNKITVDGFSIESTLKISESKPIVLGPPLHGADWRAGNGPSNTSVHRRAILPVEGKLHIAQRFAIDWVKVGANGQTFSGDAKDNKTHYAYGSEVLAVADATVVATKDGIPENVPGITSRSVPITMETIGGNHVILDLGGGRFAFYAHLQPGSLKVKPGDRVRRGQVIGLVGNSGNSTEPHLHFHVTDANSPLASEGLPYVIDSFEVTTGTGAGQRRNALPMEGARVKFD